MLQNCLNSSNSGDQPLNQLIKFSACCHWKTQSDIIKTEQQMTAVAFVGIIQWFKYHFWQKCQNDNTPISPMHARKSRKNFYYKCLTDNLYESQSTKHNTQNFIIPREDAHFQWSTSCSSLGFLAVSVPIGTPVQKFKEKKSPDPEHGRFWPCRQLSWKRFLRELMSWNQINIFLIWKGQSYNMAV